MVGRAGWPRMEGKKGKRSKTYDGWHTRSKLALQDYTAREHRSYYH